MPSDDRWFQPSAVQNVLLHLNAFGEVLCYSVEARDHQGETLEIRVVSPRPALPPAVALARALLLLTEMGYQATLWEGEPFP